MYDLHQLIDAVTIIRNVRDKLGDSLKENYQKQALTEAMRLLDDEIDRDRQEFNQWCRAESMGER